MKVIPVSNINYGSVRNKSGAIYANKKQSFGGINSQKLLWESDLALKSVLNRYSFSDFQDILKQKVEFDKIANAVKEKHKAINSFLSQLVKKPEEADPVDIFKACGISYQVTNGKYPCRVISSYHQPHSLFSFSDVGIDENKLVMAFDIVEGNADFSYSKALSTGTLWQVYGSADFKNSCIQDFPRLTYIKKNADFTNTKILKAGHCNITISGEAKFENSNFTHTAIESYYNPMLSGKSYVDVWNIRDKVGSAPFLYVYNFKNLNNLHIS